jgi:hypothetical protein
MNELLPRYSEKHVKKDTPIPTLLVPRPTMHGGFEL